MSVVKRQAGPMAKAVLDSVCAFAHRIEVLLAAPSALHASAGQLVRQVVDQKVWADLRARPVTDLADLPELGIRLSTVLDAGFPTVASVLTAHPQQLQAVFGPQVARQVGQAAAHVAELVRLDTKFGFDPEARDPLQTRLLATLAATRHVDSVLATLRPTMHQFLAQTGPLVAQAGPATVRSKRFFRSEEKRAAFAALERLEAILADPRVGSLQEDVWQAEQLANPGAYQPDALWRDYGETTGFHTLLAAVVGIGEGHADATDAAEGHLPESLRREINAEPLDSRYLTATLRRYQSFGARYAIHQKRAVLGDELGLGKTVQALAAMAHLAAGGYRHFLVVCPASVHLAWLGEIAAHTALPAHNLVPSTQGDGLPAAIDRWLAGGGIAVTTFDALGRVGESTAAGLAMVVVDEAQHVEHAESHRSRQIAAVADGAQWTLFLTGMPRSSADPDDLAPAYLRRSQEDVLTELPGKVEIDEWVRFSAADDVAYTKAVLSGNLMQMRTAAFHVAKSAKVERLVELVAEARANGRKVVVFSSFPRVLETVLVKLEGAVIGPLNGAMPPQDLQGHAAAFARRDGHAVLLSHFDAADAGLNVRAASVVIIVEPQWTPGHERHAIARTYWPGQLRTVQVRRLLAPGSVDERMREVQESIPLLSAEYARTAADAHRPPALDDPSVPLPERVVLAERHRLGIA